MAFNPETFEFRCHYLGFFAGSPQGGTSKDKYEKLAGQILDTTEKYLKLKNKDCDRGKGYQEAIVELKKVLKELEPFKEIEELSDTAISKCWDIINENEYGIIENLDNKYVQKGLLTEDDGITIIGNYHNAFLTKNVKHFSNGIISGTPDLIHGKTKTGFVIDNKASYNKRSYDKTKTLKNIYEWQVAVGYLWLTGYNKAQVIHTLVNTPVELIKAEMRGIIYRHKPFGMPTDEFEMTEEFSRVKTQIFRNHIYSDSGYIQNFDGSIEYLTEGYWKHLVALENLDENFIFKPIPENQRLKIFQAERDDSKIKHIEKQLLKARAYMARIMENPRTDDIVHIKRTIKEITKADD